MSKSSLEALASVLYDGEVAVTDIKTLAGSGQDWSPDQLAQALMKSMERVGIIVNGAIVDKNQLF